MAETPLGKLARLLGGVALTQGRLGHQVLGQLLITNTTAVELAGANVAIAATARRRGVFTQAAVGTAAPALAVHGLARREEKRLERLSQAHADALQQEDARLRAGWAELARRQKLDATDNVRIALLEREIQRLRDDVAHLERRLDERASADPTTPDPRPADLQCRVDDRAVEWSAAASDAQPIHYDGATSAEQPNTDDQLPGSPAIAAKLAKQATKSASRAKGAKRR